MIIFSRIMPSIISKLIFYELPVLDKASWNRIVFIYVDIINTTGFINPFIPIIYHPLPAYPC